MQKKGEINERDFFKTPFTRTEINALLQKQPASEMFSFRSPSFKLHWGWIHSLKIKIWIDLMLKEPRLIRRPIVKLTEKVYFWGGQ